MKFSLEASHPHAIQHYGPGGIRIAGRLYPGSLLVSPTRLIPDWPPVDPGQLRRSDLEQALELNPEILILGTGVRLTFPPVELTRDLIDRQIGLEVMDTTAACRTFNLLLGEGRRVVAGLIALGRCSAGSPNPPSESR